MTQSAAESLVDLQSLSPAMSVSSIFVPAAAASAKKSGKIAYENNACEEDLYTFLDKKPGSVDAERRGGGKKGRRHAGDALLMRKLSRQAYLVKSIVGKRGGANGGTASANVTSPTAKNCGNNSGDGSGGANTGTALFGKKRRVRLLSDHVQDFNISVPYSLNRKNRWRAADDSATGCLKALVESAEAATRGDERVKLSVVESYINLKHCLGDNHQVTAYRELDANGALLVDKIARSARGAPLKNLLNVQTVGRKGDALDSDAEDVHVQYNFARPHASSKVMGAHATSGKGRIIKSVRRLCVYPLDGNSKRGRQHHHANSTPMINADELTAEDFYTSPTPVKQANNSFITLNRQRPRRLFTLADFLVDSAQAPVIVRRSKIASDSYATAHNDNDDIENQFVITNGIDNSSEAEEDLLGENLDVNEQDTETIPINALVANIKSATDVARLGERWIARHNNEFCTFLSFSVMARNYGIENAATWEAQCRQFIEEAAATKRFAWELNPRRLAVDTSALLIKSLQRNATGTPDGVPLMIVGVEYDEPRELLRVLINGEFKCSLQQTNLCKKFPGQNDADLNTLFKNVVNVCVTEGVTFFTATKESDVTPFLPRNCYNLMAQGDIDVFPTNVSEIISTDLALKRGNLPCSRKCGDFPVVEMIIESEEENESDSDDGDLIDKELAEETNENKDNIDDDGFEHIYIDEDFDEMRSPLSSPIAITTEYEDNAAMVARAVACAHCYRVFTLANVTYFDACNHIFCFDCLSVIFMKRACNADYSIRCPADKCECEAPVALLQTILPLPTASKFAVAHYITLVTKGAEAKSTEVKRLAECPGCNAFISTIVHGCNHITCSKCKVTFCPLCRMQPHEPLTCSQSIAWATKEQLKGRFDTAVANHLATRSADARARRIDANSGWQLTRNFGRLANNQVNAKKFTNTRKKALHLMEYGYAWLCMQNKNKTSVSEKSSIAQLRVMFDGLHKKIESLDNELLFGSSLTNTDHVLTLLRQIDAGRKNINAKFGSIC